LEFTEDEIRYLVHERSGGPCLELSAWPATAWSLARAVSLLAGDSAAFGPCSAATELLEARLRQGVPQAGALHPDDAVVFVLDGLEAGVGKLAVGVCQLTADGAPGELYAWLHPGVASRACGVDDWGLGGFSPEWGGETDSPQMASIYRRLASWWTRLIDLPLASGLWLGYEGFDQIAGEATAWPGHLVTEPLIARCAGWSRWTDLGRSVAVRLEDLV
jgi:hypothetical protein